MGDVKLDPGLVHIRSTVVRVNGVGLVANTPKMGAGDRILQLPQWLVEVLAKRRCGAQEADPVFPDGGRGSRDRNNVERDFRQVRTGTVYEWVVPHTYRKTVGTFLDQGGLSARVVAGQLGHAHVSMTQDVYMGRHVVHPSAALTCEAMGE